MAAGARTFGWLFLYSDRAPDSPYSLTERPPLGEALSITPAVLGSVWLVPLELPNASMEGLRKCPHKLVVVANLPALNHRKVPDFMRVTFAS